jgi:hypothetical protein
MKRRRILLFAIAILCSEFYCAAFIPKYCRKSVAKAPFHIALNAKFSTSRSRFLSALQLSAQDVAPENDIDKKKALNPLNNDGSSLLILNFVAILWGTQHVCIKASIDTYDSTSVLNLWRFLLSTLLFSKPLLELVLKEEIQKSKLIQAGIELGLWTFLGFGFQVEITYRFQK